MSSVRTSFRRFRRKIETTVRNVRFARMSPEQRRIEVVKDALAQLEAERFVAVTDSYFDFGFYAPDCKLEDLLQTDPTCTVCARGALFLSDIRLFDKYDGWVYEGVQDRRRGLFEPIQLSLIECAFEGWENKHHFFHVDGDDLPNPYEEGGYREEDVLAYKLLLPDPNLRLRAILDNILDNNGVFVPSYADAAVVADNPEILR